MRSHGVTADAASETVAFYEAAGMRDATVVVPPSKPARVSRGVGAGLHGFGLSEDADPLASSTAAGAQFPREFEGCTRSTRRNITSETGRSTNEPSWGEAT